MNIKHYHGIPLTGLPHIRPDTTKNLQTHPLTTYSGIIQHQTDTQRHYIPGIITSDILDITNGISKSTWAKQSGNWDRWCKFLTQSGIMENYWGDYKVT